MERLKLELVAIICLVVIINGSCFTNSSNVKKTENNSVSKTIALKVNNQEYQSIGFKLIEDDESIGVKSIFLSDSSIYLADTFFSNIKKININNGDMVCSKPLGYSRVWLRDICVQNEKIFVLSDLA